MKTEHNVVFFAHVSIAENQLYNHYGQTDKLYTPYSSTYQYTSLNLTTYAVLLVAIYRCLQLNMKKFFRHFSHAKEQIAGTQLECPRLQQVASGDKNAVVSRHAASIHVVYFVQD